MGLFHTFWSEAFFTSNLLICLQTLGAMGLGLLLGLERNYHGHAAGMRTYALVAGAAAAATAIGGFSGQWFGGPALTQGHVTAEATHVIQGIVTGIGFLGAGVILRDGATIRGLSTAASIWATAVIGIIVGVGFYAAAIFTTIATAVLMTGFKRLEMRLPHRRQLKLTLTLGQPPALPIGRLHLFFKDLGYTLGDVSCKSDLQEEHFSYDLVLHSDASQNFQDLADALAGVEGVVSYSLVPMRD